MDTDNPLAAASLPQRPPTWRTQAEDLVAPGDLVALTFGQESVGKILSADGGRPRVELVSGPGAGGVRTIDVENMLLKVFR